jgi:hypothetical protein
LRIRKVGAADGYRGGASAAAPHADLVDPISLEQFLLGTGAGLDFDVMLEAKAKGLALLALRDRLCARGHAL